MPLTQPIKWHGGKSYLAPWIIIHMPPHVRYCEPFFGGGAVLFQKPCENVAEFVNDINGELTNFWRTIRDQPQFGKFQQIISTVPFSEIEWQAYRDASEVYLGDSILDAVAFFVRFRQSRQGLGRDFSTPTSRLRRGMNEQVSAWLSAVDGLPEAHARLRRVEIRNMPAIDFIRELDSTDTLFYCDPPYLHSTRSSTGEYQHEMTETQHFDLLKVLAQIKGKFLLSGYHSPMYDGDAERFGWRCIEKEIDNKASSKKSKEKKIECLWMNF